MSIANALQTALGGLTATSKLAEITSGNLANALTDGYGRQVVELSSEVVGGTGVGVSVAGIDRAASPELTAARRRADGDLAQSQAGFDALQRLDRSIGDPASGDSLTSRLNAFENAMRQLGETPELGPRQYAAASAAQDVAVKLNQISTESARVRQTADDDIARQVSEVNGALEKIAKLNRQIQIFGASGRETASLIDQREQLIDRVASIVPIREQMRAGGVVEITTPQGLVMANTRAQQIEFTASPVITAAMAYDNGTGALGGLTLNGVDITPGGPSNQQIDSGSLAGLFEVRDRIAPEFSGRADALAADLMQRLAAPGVDPTLAPGDPGLFTDNGAAYDPTLKAGLAGRIRVNAAVDPGAGGNPALLRDGLGATAPGPAANGDIPRAMLDALTARGGAVSIPGLPSGLSLAESAQGLAELASSGRVSAETDVTGRSGAREVLASAESKEIGVNSDSELQALIQIEQAYAANVQVIQTAARMLDNLMEI